MRPILLGMNNPLSSNPDDALVYWPEGCTGHRVLGLLQRADPAVSGDDYLEMFDRRNLVAGRAWSDAAAREAARQFDTRGSRSVVVLGAKTWAAFGAPATPWLSSCSDGQVEWWRVPHPSGLNRWYDVPGNARSAADLLLKIGRGG